MDLEFGMDAAANGDGVFVTHKIVVEDALIDGKLVKVFPLEIDSGSGFYLVYPEKKANIKVIKTFSSWLKKTLRNIPRCL